MKEKKIQKLLNLAHNMIEEGKLSEVLEILNSLKPFHKYTERQKAIFYTLTSEIHMLLGNYPKSIETAEKGMQCAKNTEESIEVVDTFLNMASVLKVMGNNSESMKLLRESSEMLKNLTEISEEDRKRRKGLIYLEKGTNYYFLGETLKSIKLLKDSIDLLEKWGSQHNLARAYSIMGNMISFTGEYNKSLSYILKSQKICENKESPQYNLPKLLNLFVRSSLYSAKAEFQEALEYAKKCESLARKKNVPYLLYGGLALLGSIYESLGEFDHSIKFYKEAIFCVEKIGSISDVVEILHNLFRVYINKGDRNAAQQIFNKIEQIRDKEKENKKIDLAYRLSRALLMKKSKRIRDLGVAQDIFTIIATEEVIYLGMTQTAILNLCEMLLDEYKDTQNVEALDKSSSLLINLQKAAEKRHSYPTLAETYLLEAKLSMIKFDFKKSRHSLTQAQQIAEKYGLKHLSIQISNEHDKLLKNIEVWEQMKEENVAFSKRLEKIDIDDQISMMLKKKPAETPETTPESPILLLIMANSGIPLYTKIFDKEWKIKEELFSGFLSAFNSFSDEIFSEGLDRANFGKYTILMTSMPPFMSCYVFEGQSYLANQKFSKFNENIHESEHLWKILISANRTGRIIQDGSSFGLGKLVMTIF